MNFLLVLFVGGKFLDPLIKTLNLISEIIECKQIFFENLLIQTIWLN